MTLHQILLFLDDSFHLLSIESFSRTYPACGSASHVSTPLNVNTSCIPGCNRKTRAWRRQVRIRRFFSCCSQAGKRRSSSQAMENLQDLFLVISGDPFLSDWQKDGLLLCLIEQQLVDSDRVGFRLDVEELTERECWERFRFNKDDLLRLSTALEIPSPMVASNRTTWSALEGLCVVLRRLAYPNRLGELVAEFGRGRSELSIIFNGTLKFITDRWGYLLRDIDAPWMTVDVLEESCAAMGARCPLQNLWGCIDGTPRLICRPSIGQRLMYSGHKRVHCLKYQAIMSPCGIIAHLYGPVEGRRHDSGMLHMSGLLDQLREHRERVDVVDGAPNSLYGDPAYPIRPHLLAPYRDGHLTPDQADFNKQMSSVREAVEWGFGNVAGLFAFVDYKKNQKLYLQPVGRYYQGATIPTNCHTCLYESQTSQYFGMNPPALEDYLQ